MRFFPLSLSSLHLAGFLSIQLQACLSTPHDVLTELHHLEYAHDWMERESHDTWNMSLSSMMEQMKFALAELLQHVFVSPTTTSTSTISSQTATTSATAEFTPSLVDVHGSVSPLLESLMRWHQHPQQEQHAAFLHRFVVASATATPTVIPAARRLFTPSPPMGASVADPASSMANLFARCMNEMGGGAARKQVAEWMEARQAERAYAGNTHCMIGIINGVVSSSTSYVSFRFLFPAPSLSPSSLV